MYDAIYWFVSHLTNNKNCNGYKPENCKAVKKISLILSSRSQKTYIGLYQLSNKRFGKRKHLNLFLA